MKPQHSGLFVTLEGGEGAGKSTLAARIATALSNQDIEVLLTREPGGSPGAEAIRALLVRDDAPSWSPRTQALLFNAARNDHLETRIRPALARGALVICDRYVDSTLAYQSAASGVSQSECLALAEWIGAEQPDLTLVLDLPVEHGLSRSKGALAGESRFEGQGLAFHQLVRSRFLEIAAADPARCRVIDAGLSPEAVLQAALAAIEPLLERA